MTLIELVYVSVASREMSKQDILDILESAHKNNTANDITGMLLYRDPYFIQVLEGEEAKVMPIFNKIKDDDRHNRVLTVRQSEISERSFSDWSMGFKDLKEVNPHEIEGYTDFLTKPVDESFFTDSPNNARALLYSFRNQIQW